MIRYEMKKSLGRKMRQDDPAELGISNWTLIRNALQSAGADEALDFADYESTLVRGLINNLTLHRNIFLTRLADFDELEVEKIHRQIYSPRVKDWVSTTPGVEESLQRFAEVFKVFTENLTVTEEPDRYVMRLDPCGTGGRLFRTQKSVGSTRKAYPWSWSKSGIPYYCTHCCLFQEILPIEERGYPICVTQRSERANDLCIHYYYKKPELIPDEYFTRIGKTPYRLAKGSRR